MNDTFDAHVHTCCSDAAPDQTPEEVCRAAREAGLGHLCITDHDRMLPENQRRALAQAYGLDVISGCEFSGVTALSTDRRVTVHVLGLWLPEQSQSQALFAVLAHNQAQDFPSYCKAMLQKLWNLGIDPSGRGVEASFALLRSLNPRTRHYGKNAVAHLLVHTGFAATPQQAKDRWLSAFGGRLAFVPAGDYCRYADLRQTMAAANTGLSVLCHLYYYQLVPEENEELVRRFRELGGQALEVDYGFYTSRQQETLMGYCRKYGLLPVASSDRHEVDHPFKRGDPRWFRALQERCRALHGALPGEETGRGDAGDPPAVRNG